MRTYLLAGCVFLAACGAGNDDTTATTTDTEATTPPVETASPEPQPPAIPELEAGLVVRPTAEVVANVRVPGKVAIQRNEDDTLLITGTNAGKESGGETSGVAFVLSGEDEEAASATRATIHVLAKSADGTETGMNVSYSTNDVGNSGWQTFTVGEEFEVHSFEYVIPPMKDGNGDFLGILPEAAEPGIVVAAVGFDFEKLPNADTNGDAE